MDRALDFIQKLIMTFGVRMRCYGEDFSGLEDFDEGLRSRLFQKTDTSALAEFLRGMEEKAMYLWNDAYGCCYCSFRPGEFGGNDTTRYCIIGPWLKKPMDDATIDDILRQGHIPYHLRKEVVNYIMAVPQFDWESFLFDCVSFFYGEECHIRIVSLDMAVEGFTKSYSPKPDEILARRIIKERYKAENAMLKAVSEGDADKALRYMANLKSTLPLEEYARDDMRNGKNYTIVLCVLLRKAVEDGFVHPAHIHSVSSDFLHRIENAANVYDLIRLDELMVRRYCSLIKEFSLRDYSPLIRDVINFVDFNLQESFTVASLAKQFKVSPSNLSTQFRREKGMPLTGYINVKRLERAKSMLYGTGLYIKEIADQCGFMDDNYFSRLFKRYFGISPKEFRQKITALRDL